jgi:hypothetical protein
MNRYLVLARHFWSRPVSWETAGSLADSTACPREVHVPWAATGYVGVGVGITLVSILEAGAWVDGTGAGGLHDEWQRPFGCAAAVPRGQWMHAGGIQRAAGRPLRTCSDAKRSSMQRMTACRQSGAIARTRPVFCGRRLSSLGLNHAQHHAA